MAAKTLEKTCAVQLSSDILENECSPSVISTKCAFPPLPSNAESVVATGAKNRRPFDKQPNETTPSTSNSYQRSKNDRNSQVARESAINRSATPVLVESANNITYSQALQTHETLSSDSHHVNLTSGSRDEKIADLEVQPKSFFNTQHIAKFYNISFPGVDISKDVNVFQIEHDLYEKLGNNVKIEKQNRNTLLLEISTKRQADKIIKITTLAGQQVTVSLDPILSYSKGIVKSKTMTYLSEDELQNRLSSQGVTNVTRFKQQDPSSYPIFLLTFKASSTPALIKLNQWHCELVEEYTPSPMRCKKCQKLGHTKNQCRNKEIVCERCATPHRGECSAPLLCINCGGQHAASSTECEHYIMRREILRVQYREKITFRKSKAKVRIQYASTNKQYNFETPNIESSSETTDRNPPGRSPPANQQVETVATNATELTTDNVSNNTQTPLLTENTEQLLTSNKAQKIPNAPPTGDTVRECEGGVRGRGRGKKAKVVGGKVESGKSLSESGAFRALAEYGDVDRDSSCAKRPRHPSGDNGVEQPKKVQYSKIEVIDPFQNNSNPDEAIHPSEY